MEPSSSGMETNATTVTWNANSSGNSSSLTEFLIGNSTTGGRTICWNECEDDWDDATGKANETIAIPNRSDVTTSCPVECIDLGSVDREKSDGCWDECYNLYPTGSDESYIYFNTSNAANESSTVYLEMNDYDVNCWKDCVDLPEIPPEILAEIPPTDSPIGFMDFFHQTLNNSTGEMEDGEWNPNNLSDSQILTQTFELYGSVFFVCLTIFCIVRRVFPRAYNLRSGWIDTKIIEPSTIAKHPKSVGFIKWIWKVWLVSDLELFDECGMDALCLCRVLEWGARLTAVGSFIGCAMLMPVYATAGNDQDDSVARLNTSNVPDGGTWRFAATVVAAYLIFGYVLWSTLQEFEWFYKFRYDFLSKKLPRNYAIYVRNLPKEYRTRKALVEYFSHFEEPFVRFGNGSSEERLGLMLADHNVERNAATKYSTSQAWVSLQIPRLKELVEKRAAVLTKLEHQINVQIVCGKYPKARSEVSGQMVTLVDKLFEELQQFNLEISDSIERIELRAGLEDPSDYDAQDYQNPYRIERNKRTSENLFFDAKLLQSSKSTIDENEAISEEEEIVFSPQTPSPIKPHRRVSLVTGGIEEEGSQSDDEDGTEPIDSDYSSFEQNDPYTDIIPNIDNEIASNDLSKKKGLEMFKAAATQVATVSKTVGMVAGSAVKDVGAQVGKVGKVAGSAVKDVGVQVGKVGKVAGSAVKDVGLQVGEAANVVGLQVVKGAYIVGDQVGKAASLVPFLGSKEDDGAPMTAGFVTFSTLKACQVAKQMMHSKSVFGMEVFEAPGIEDINWANVGKTHKELEIGLLMSTCLTVALCLFWTLVITFISTVSSIQGLTLIIPKIGEWLEAAPWLEPVLAQIAPLMILGANSALKYILEALSNLEGPVSGAVVQASLFTKFSSFLIIQNLFVVAISGSIISELSAMVQDPTQILALLANSLPNRSAFFIQMLLADAFLGISSELLRVYWVLIAFARSLYGPKLTVAERRTTWMGLRPFADPYEFEHAEVLANSVLYFVVFFVYATLAPITSVVMLLCFLIMSIAYRHQFLFVYPTSPDSGGRLWIQFMKVVPTSVLIGEVTISALLAAKHAPVASIMMIPLIIITVLFQLYIRQKHFQATEFLPGCECVEADRKNNLDGPMDLRFLSNHYLQPQLRDKVLYPTNATLEMQLKHRVIETPSEV